MKKENVHETVQDLEEKKDFYLKIAKKYSNGEEEKISKRLEEFSNEFVPVNDRRNRGRDY